MRKQPRTKALTRVLSLSATLAVAMFVTSPWAATAHVAPKTKVPPTEDAFVRLRTCESGGDYTAKNRNRYFGAYQFSPSTWRAMGLAGLPHEAPPEVQDDAARRLQARSGWGQWPACARKLGLR